ncbi:hypothetical protein KHP62_17315 [Rhodobacteraceae bacterium NNCM2]|nr:hypothetical protein [Coraliihabitans acroporae]
MSLFKTDDPLFDYDPYSFGRTRSQFRGPMPDLRAPYLVCLGSTHTFGRFVSEPYPSQIEGAFGRPVVNFGTEGAGPGMFLADADILHVANAADICIIEVMSARAISNRMYTVRPRRNERLMKVSDLLLGLYPEVDFGEFSGVKGMLKRLEEVDPNRFRLVHNEIRNAWIGRMQRLMNEIDRPKILLWFADHAPPERDEVQITHGGGRHPAFVDGAMIDAVEGNRDAYVECASNIGLPQDLTRDGQPVLFQPTGRAIARNTKLPSPQMHDRAAEALIDAINRLEKRL